MRKPPRNALPEPAASQPRPPRRVFTTQPGARSCGSVHRDMKCVNLTDRRNALQIPTTSRSWLGGADPLVGTAPACSSRSDEFLAVSGAGLSFDLEPGLRVGSFYAAGRTLRLRFEAIVEDVVATEGRCCRWRPCRSTMRASRKPMRPG